MAVRHGSLAKQPGLIHDRPGCRIRHSVLSDRNGGVDLKTEGPPGTLPSGLHALTNRRKTEEKSKK